MSVRLDRLEIDIDSRLLETWATIVEVGADSGGVFDLDFLAACTRTAYAHGYTDALRERRRWQLYTDNGYPAPPEPRRNA